MRLRMIAITFATAAVCVAGAPVYGDEPGKKAALLERPIASAADARLAALDITGFGPRLRGVESKAMPAAIVALPDDDTVFLSMTPAPRRVWRVVFDSVDIRTPLAISSNDTTSSLRRFEVLLDSASGTLLRIESLLPEGDRTEDDGVNSDRIERQMRTKTETYWGPVTGDSVVPFIRALNSAVGCAPKKARKIAAILVTYSSLTRDSMAVWVINTYGSTAGQRPFGDPDAQPCCLWNRCIVNARTGQWESWDTRE